MLLSPLFLGLLRLLDSPGVLSGGAAALASTDFFRVFFAAAGLADTSRTSSITGSGTCTAGLALVRFDLVRVNRNPSSSSS